MWQDGVNKIMAQEGTRRVNGKVASDRTQTLTREVVFASIRRLHKLGYKIQDPQNLGERHIKILVNDWWYCQKKRVKTIQNDLSRLRVFCRMMGKPGLVGSVCKYLPEVDPSTLKVQTAAATSKSWAGQGVDFLEQLQAIDAKDRRLGLMLRLEVGFGLRREEVLKCNPHVQDFGSHLQIFPGMGKGGRWRNIPIKSPAQRFLLEYVKARSEKNKPLGWEYSAGGKAVTLEQNVRRYENLMAALGFTKSQLGVTGHGLRAQFAENHALLYGLMPPSLNVLPQVQSRVDRDVVVNKLAQALGHSRKSVMAAYIGKLGNASCQGWDARSAEHIRLTLRILEIDALSAVPMDRADDCEAIQAAMAESEVALNLEQAHALWSMHSRRHGVEWMVPEREIKLLLVGTASGFLNEVLNLGKGD